MSNIIKGYYQDMSDLDLILAIKEIKRLEPQGLIGERVRNIAKDIRGIIGKDSSPINLEFAKNSLLMEAAYRFEENSGFLTDDEFIKKYRPIMSDDGSNTLREFEAVELVNLDGNFTWSWVEQDDKTYIVPGMRKVNRIAYYRTEVPHEGDNVVVLWTDDSEIDS